MSLAQRLSQPVGPLTSPDVPPLLSEGAGLEAWVSQRGRLCDAWAQFLGEPEPMEFDPTPEVVYTFTQPGWQGTAYRQPTSPETRQLVWILEPNEPIAEPRPAVLIPFYHPHWMLAWDPETGESITDRPTIRFAKQLLAQGYVCCCVEAFPFNTVPEPEPNTGFAWWQAAAEHLLARHPRWTGMGKLLEDTRLALDLLCAQPRLDFTKIAVAGHSLGGKMTFYTACLDERIGAAVASDFGIGWESTNWHNLWYLGDKLAAPGFARMHHELLALMAPRPFLLIAGDVDGVESSPYLEAAREVYRLYGRPEALGCFDHDTGHTPTAEAMGLAWRWLAEVFGLPVREDRLPDAV